VRWERLAVRRQSERARRRYSYLPTQYRDNMYTTYSVLARPGHVPTAFLSSGQWHQQYEMQRLYHVAQHHNTAHRDVAAPRLQHARARKAGKSKPTRLNVSHHTRITTATQQTQFSCLCAKLSGQPGCRRMSRVPVPPPTIPPTAAANKCIAEPLPLSPSANAHKP
jgi:hypothetical protein